MSKKSNVIEQGTVSFYMTGEGFTYLVRDFWNSNLVKTAIEICTDSGIPAEVAVKICTGEYKCVGDTREGDHTLGIEDDENPQGIYFTLESQLENIEKKFVRVSQKLFKLVRKHEMLAGVEAGDGTLKVPGEATIFGAAYRKDESKNNKKMIDELKKEQKNALENLEILYPLVGKKMSDLPVTELGVEWSDIEFDHYDSYTYKYKKEYTNPTIDTDENKIKSVIEKKPFDENSYDQGDDETKEDYDIRIGKLAIKNNPIVDVKTTKTRNAWISPEGKIYDVEKQPFPMHINAASDFQYMGIVPKDIYNESKWLEDNGWIKLTSDEFYMDGQLTQAQIDMLMDYMTARNLKTINWFGYEESLSEIIKRNKD